MRWQRVILCNHLRWGRRSLSARMGFVVTQVPKAGPGAPVRRMEDGGEESSVKSSELAPARAGLASWQVGGWQRSGQPPVVGPLARYSLAEGSWFLNRDRGAENCWLGFVVSHPFRDKAAEWMGHPSVARDPFAGVRRIPDPRGGASATRTKTCPQGPRTLGTRTVISEGFQVPRSSRRGFRVAEWSFPGPIPAGGLRARHRGR